MIDGEILRLTYLLDTGDLRIESGHIENVKDYVFNPDDESLSEIEPNVIEPFIVKDISRWWGYDEDEDEDEE